MVSICAIGMTHLLLPFSQLRKGNAARHGHNPLRTPKTCSYPCKSHRDISQLGHTNALIHRGFVQWHTYAVRVESALDGTGKSAKFQRNRMLDRPKN